MAASDPSVSVCMATYNGAQYLREQIDSILMQLRPGDLLLVADDGSTDGTADILRGYGNRLEITHTTRAGGVVANFGRVLQQVKTDVAVLADQDDVWLPGHLERMRAALRTTQLVLCNATVVDAQLTPSGATLFDQLQPRLGFWANLYRTSSFVGCCMGVRRELIEQALPLPVFTPWHDWLLGLLACLRKQVALIQAPSLLYRRHEGNASQTGVRSRNSLWRKLWLRMRVLTAVIYCLMRSGVSRR